MPTRRNKKGNHTGVTLLQGTPQQRRGELRRREELLYRCWPVWDCFGVGYVEYSELLHCVVTIGSSATLKQVVVDRFHALLSDDTVDEHSYGYDFNQWEAKRVLLYATAVLGTHEFDFFLERCSMLMRSLGRGFSTVAARLCRACWNIFLAWDTKGDGFIDMREVLSAWERCCEDCIAEADLVGAMTMSSIGATRTSRRSTIMTRYGRVYTEVPPGKVSYGMLCGPILDLYQHSEAEGIVFLDKLYTLVRQTRVSYGDVVVAYSGTAKQKEAVVDGLSGQLRHCFDGMTVDSLLDAKAEFEAAQDDVLMTKLAYAAMILSGNASITMAFEEQTAHLLHLLSTDILREGLWVTLTTFPVLSVTHKMLRAVALDIDHPQYTPPYFLRYGNVVQALSNWTCLVARIVCTVHDWDLTTPGKGHSGWSTKEVGQASGGGSGLQSGLTSAVVSGVTTLRESRRTSVAEPPAVYAPRPPPVSKPTYGLPGLRPSSMVHSMGSECLGRATMPSLPSSAGPEAYRVGLMGARTVGRTAESRATVPKTSFFDIQQPTNNHRGSNRGSVSSSQSTMSAGTSHTSGISMCPDPTTILSGTRATRSMASPPHSPLTTSVTLDAFETAESLVFSSSIYELLGIESCIDAVVRACGQHDVNKPTDNPLSFAESNSMDLSAVTFRAEIGAAEVDNEPTPHKPLVELPKRRRINPAHYRCREPLQSRLDALLHQREAAEEALECRLPKRVAWWPQSQPMITECRASDEKEEEEKRTDDARETEVDGRGLARSCSTSSATGSRYPMLSAIAASGLKKPSTNSTPLLGALCLI